MKGIILAGGEGTRLRPLTKVTSKVLLPVYNKPMIMYPIETLIKAGIEDILIIVSPHHAGDFLHLLGSGKELGVRFTYEIQDKPEGLPQAFTIGANFIGDDTVALILGDNIFEDDFHEAIQGFKSGAHLFAKEVPDPERFGVVKFDDNMNVLAIEEKPKKFLSNYAITGLYLYDARVIEVARGLKPSARNEFEITDLHRWYLERGEIKVDIFSGEWIDAGTFEALLKANNFAAKKIETNAEATRG